MVTTNRPARRTPTPVHSHTEERDGDSAESTRAFRGAESTSRKPAQNGYGELTEEKSLVPVLQHFVLSNVRYLFHSSPSLL